MSQTYLAPEQISTNQIDLSGSKTWPLFKLIDHHIQASKHFPILYLNNTQYHVLFGHKQLNKDITTCICIERPESSHQLFLLFCELYDAASWPLMTKLSVMNYLYFNAKITRNILQKEFLKTLNLHQQGHQANHFNTLLKISQLPTKVQGFCQEKKYSLKQLKQLLLYPPSLLLQLSELDGPFKISASQFILLAQHAHDMAQNNRPITKIIQQIQQSNERPSQRSTRLINELKTQLTPRLSQANKHLHSLSATLPEQLQVNWDPNLEIKSLNLNVSFKRNEDIQSIAQLIQAPKTQKTLKAILKGI